MEKEHLNFIESTVKVAKQSSCQRAKCGSIIVNNDEIIGQGFNSPPNNLESQRKCKNNKEDYQKNLEIGFLDAQSGLKHFDIIKK